MFSDVTVHLDSAVYLHVDSDMLLELGKECGKGGWVKWEGTVGERDAGLDEGETKELKISEISATAE